MLNKQIKESLLWDLKNGVFQVFQIEEQLRLKGVSSFETAQLKREILEAYYKDHPRY